MRALAPLVLALLLAACPLAAAPVAPAAAKARLDRVVAALEAERERLHVPGLAVAVVENDRVVLLHAFGVRDLESRAPVDSETRFPIGSCSKAFTALAAEISQEDGKLSLDDSPHRYFPWFHMADSEADRLVTLRDMLSHRTGLMAYADLAAEPNVLTRLEYVRAATSARPTAKFREKFQYSNAMIVAVGEIVAKVQGTTWERVIEQRILAPLGMRSSVASTADFARLPNHATGYDDPTGKGAWRPVPPPKSLAALAPAGSIVSSASDMARWVRMMLAEGTFEGHRIVSAASVRDVMTPHTQVRGTLWYGLGWGLYEWNHHRVVEHNGGSDGISALVSLMPEKKLGFVLLLNTTPTSLTKVTNAGKILWPILTGETERAVSPAPAAAAHAEPQAARDTSDLPATSELLARMTAAAGGERNLRRHRTIEIEAHKSYANHGIEAETREYWELPDRRDVEERWSAVGRSIGWIRFFSDSTRAGQETSFGQDQLFTGDELERALRKAKLDWFLEPARFGLRVRVVAREKRDGESVYVLEAASAGGGSVRYAVSARTSLVLERTSGSTTETYSDFRNVDGRVWPFRTTIADELGATDVVVRALRFDSPLPAGAFGPRKPTTASPAASRP